MVSPLNRKINFLKRKLSGNKKSKKKKLPKKSTDGGGKKRKKSEGKKRQVNGNYKIKKKEQDDGSMEKIEKKTKWKVYSLKGCPYCDKVKDVLNEKGIDFDYKEFASLSGDEQTKILESMDKVKNGFRTYPRVFAPTADGKFHNFIGGYNDTCTYLKS
jgi:glutaredoxin